MALTSLLAPEDDGDGEVYDYTPPAFGYGTEIQLTDDQCKALGLTAAWDAGQPVKISATGLVTRSVAELGSDGKEVRLCIQLTAMSLDKDGAASAAKAIKTLYPTSS